MALNRVSKDKLMLLSLNSFFESSSWSWSSFGLEMEDEEEEAEELTSFFHDRRKTLTSSKDLVIRTSSNRPKRAIPTLKKTTTPSAQVRSQREMTREEWRE